VTKADELTRDEAAARSAAATAHPSGRPATTVTLEVVVPVLDEERILAASITRLHRFLSSGFPWSWRITIVDNGSADATWSCAQDLARTLPGVHALRLERKGRGLALRTAWTASDASVVAYMDVDLSTDLAALLPLVAPLVSGHSDLAIGSRLAPGSHVARHPQRELISRAYNLVLRGVLATRVRDAQCGFKAVRADVARRLLPEVRDDGWFFDTELLLLAERNGLRIHEVPVDWTDDTDSRVRVARTAIADLRGVARMAARFVSGNGRFDLGDVERPTLADDFGRWLVSFAIIGALSTAASLGLFLALRSTLGPIGADVVAVSATFVANTWANARFTARARRTQWTLAFAVYVAALALTSAGLVIVALLGGDAGAQLVVLAVTWTLATAARLVLLRGRSGRPQ
jgi:glycosyltransferase involved in cell wall biosynthesis